MATNLEKLAKEAMALPGEERAELAEMLVQSLGGSELSDIGRLWVMEAKRRLDEVTDGVVEPIPGGEALRKVRDLISRPD
ncbi:MAG TPA: addiction module protein [Blastocatellia bacterium]|nr:addiction module protein [Blastocatellia bacterium]